MDSDLISILALMGLTAVIVAAIAWYAITMERKLKAAMAEMVARNGWEFEQRGKWARALRDPSAGWELELNSPRSSKNNRSPGSTRFRAPSPRLPGGLCFVTVDMGGPSPAAMMGGALSLLGTGIGQMLAKRFLGAEHAALMPDLQDFPSPAGAHVTVMSTYDPAPHVNLAAARALHDWTPGRGDQTPPFLLLDDGGMHLRINRGLTDPVQIEKFVALAQRIRADLGSA